MARRDKKVLADQVGLDPERIPKHIAIIMDGNGRWARSQRMPRVYGHRRGADRVREVVEAAGEIGVKQLTLFAFSDENWARSRGEINAIMRLLNVYLKKERDDLNRNNVRLSAIGDLERLPAENQKMLGEVIDFLRGNTGLKLTLALSYGAHSEIVRAARAIADKVAEGEIDSAAINARMIEENLYSGSTEPVDLLIRTSGEQRISNFLLWQIAYAELYFTPIYWPQFSRDDFFGALREYQRRERRFGKVLDESGATPLKVANPNETYA